MGGLPSHNRYCSHDVLVESPHTLTLKQIWCKTRGSVSIRAAHMARHVPRGCLRRYRAKNKKKQGVWQLSAWRNYKPVRHRCKRRCDDAESTRCPCRTPPLLYRLVTLQVGDQPPRAQRSNRERVDLPVPEQEHGSDTAKTHSVARCLPKSGRGSLGRCR